MVKLTNHPTDCEQCDYQNTLPSLSAICLENCSLDMSQLDFLPSCSALTKLHLHKCEHLKPNMHSTPTSPSFRMMHLTSLTVNCSCEIMSKVLAMCDPACLESLSMTESWRPSVYDKNFLKQMLPLCTRLVALEFAGVGIENEAFIALIRMCPQLQHLSVVNELWVAGYAMVHVGQFLTELKTFNIVNTICNDAILEPLIQHRASSLKGVFVKVSCITVEGIRATLQACPQLTWLGFQFDSSDDDAALFSTIAEHGLRRQKLRLQLAVRGFLPGTKSAIYRARWKLTQQFNLPYQVEFN